MVDNAPGLSQIRYWCQKVLPAVYDDSLSYYECVCKLVAEINKVIDTVNAEGEAITQLQAEVKELQEALEQFKEHGFDDYYKAQVQAWIDAHLTDIFNSVVKQVYFGLTLDGHFVAYIPQGWDDITFDTGMVYELDTYGRLILRWRTDSTSAVDQTPEVVRDGSSLNVTALLADIKSDYAKLVLQETDERIDEDDYIIGQLQTEYDSRIAVDNDLQRQIDELKEQLAQLQNS